MVGLGAIGEGEKKRETRVQECTAKDVDEEIDCGEAEISGALT